MTCHVMVLFEKSFHDGVSDETRSKLDSLFFELWMGRNVEEASRSVRKAFCVDREAPLDFTSSHTGMTIVEVLASRGECQKLLKDLLQPAIDSNLITGSIIKLD